MYTVQYIHYTRELHLNAEVAVAASLREPHISNHSRDWTRRDATGNMEQSMSAIREQISTIVARKPELQKTSVLLVTLAGEEWSGAHAWDSVLSVFLTSRALLSSANNSERLQSSNTHTLMTRIVFVMRRVRISKGCPLIRFDVLSVCSDSDH